MNNLLQSLFSVKGLYPNAIDRQRARGLLILNAFVFVAALVSMLTVSFSAGFLSSDLSVQVNFSQIVTLITPIFTIFIHWFVRRGQLNIGVSLFIAIQLIAIGVLLSDGLQTANTVLIFMPLAAGASLLGRRGLLAIFALLMLFILVGAVAQSRLDPSVVIYPAERWQLDFSLVTLSVVLSTFFLYVFNGLTQRIAQEAHVEIDALRQISHFIAATDAKDEQALYADVINFTRTTLKYPFAQVFYMGDDGKLSRRLRVNMGTNMLADKVADVTDGSGIMQAAMELKTVKLSIEDAALRWKHFLPSTTHGVALPIVHEGNLLGVLDVQRDDDRAFTSREIEALEALVKNVGATAARVRLLGALRENIQQQTEITATLRARLQELRLSPGASGGATWTQYLAQRGEQLFGFNLDAASGHVTEANDLPSSIKTVLQTGALQISTEGEHKIINVPISLRGEVLGAMAFTVPKDRVLTERQMETAQIVANRLALALENKRLFEQSQAVAARERKANEATNLLISATNVEAVMNVAAASFNDALGAINTRIHLQPSLIAETESKEEPVA